MGENYFSEREKQRGVEPGRYVALQSDVAPIQIVPGLTVRPVFGTNLNLSFVWMDPHTTAPVHAHEEEQIGTIVDGSIEFELDGVKRVLRRGDVYVAPAFVPHGAVTRDEPCLLIDAFSPPREALRAAAGRI